MPSTSPTRIALLLGRPDPAGGHFCNALASSYQDGARAGGRDVRVLDIASDALPPLRSKAEFESPDTPPAVRAAQDTLRWAEHIVIIHPLWLGMMPAALKAYLEQVLRPRFGFGYSSSGRTIPLLRGRSAHVVVTMGMPAPFYGWFFGAHGSKVLQRSILGICGVGPITETRIGNIESTDGRQRLQWLERLRRFGREGA